MLQTKLCAGGVTGAGGRPNRHRVETAVHDAELAFTGIGLTGSERRREPVRHNEVNPPVTTGRSPQSNEKTHRPRYTAAICFYRHPRRLPTSSQRVRVGLVASESQQVSSGASCLQRIFAEQQVWPIGEYAEAKLTEAPTWQLRSTQTV
jgi:hypothetical protein